MYGPFSHHFRLWTLMIVLVMMASVHRHHDVSAESDPLGQDIDNNYDDDDDSDNKGVGDIAELSLPAVEDGVMRNTSQPSQSAQDVDRESRLERKILAMEHKIQSLEEQLHGLRKFIYKHTRRKKKEKCGNGQCPVGAMKYGCDCLLYVDHSRTWRDARAHCARMTGKLVTVHSQGLQRHIERFLKAQLGNLTVEIFTGLIHTTRKSGEPAFTGELHGSGEADGWYWKELQDNVTALERKHFMNWAPGQPPNITMKPSCMQLKGTADKGLQWHATQCNAAKGFICHFKVVLRRQRKGKKGRKTRRGRKRNKGRGKKRRRGKRRIEDNEEESERIFRNEDEKHGEENEGSFTREEKETEDRRFRDREEEEEDKSDKRFTERDEEKDEDIYRGNRYPDQRKLPIAENG